MSTVEREDREGGIVILTLNRPDRLNTLDVTLVSELHAALTLIEKDESVRVVILTGAGKAFCAGLDLNGYGDDDRVEREGPMISTFGRQRDIASLVQRIRKLRPPVIAAVNGAAAGGGLALVCAADMRLASTDAVFAVSFIRAGYSACDIGVSWLLPRLVGVAPAHELMLTGRRFDALEANRIGLVTRLTEPGALLDSALTAAGQILLNPPLSVELTKVGMWAAVETPSFDVSVEFENRQQMVTAFTEDRAEATAAFLSKRTPTYSRR